MPTMRVWQETKKWSTWHINLDRNLLQRFLEQTPFPCLWKERNSSKKMPIGCRFNQLQPATHVEDETTWIKRISGKKSVSISNKFKDDIHKDILNAHMNIFKTKKTCLDCRLRNFWRYFWLIVVFALCIKIEHLIHAKHITTHNHYVLHIVYKSMKLVKSINPTVSNSFLTASPCFLCAFSDTKQTLLVLNLSNIASVKIALLLLSRIVGNASKKGSNQFLRSLNNGSGFTISLVLTVKWKQNEPNGPKHCKLHYYWKVYCHFIKSWTLAQ